MTRDDSAGARRQDYAGDPAADRSAWLGARVAAAGEARRPVRALPAARRPLALRAGDRVRLIAPAGPVSAQRVRLAIEHVRALGLEPVPPVELRRARGYLAGDDDARAGELVDALQDRSVRAVMAMRGGTGCMRLLPALEGVRFGTHAPLLVGFSDLTAVQMALLVRHGLVSLQGPMPSMPGWDAPSAAALSRALTLDVPWGALAPHPFRWEVVVPGRARGRLVGGNLAMLDALRGTPWDPPLTGALLYLEDVDESPHRIERMLLSLAWSGKLRGIAGVVVATLHGCVPTGRKPSLTVRHVLHDVLGGLRVPVVFGMPAGHVFPTLTVPIGVRATLDAGRGTLTIDEPVLAPRVTDL